MSANTAKYAEMVEQLTKSPTVILEQLAFDKVNLLHMAVGVMGEAAEFLQGVMNHAVHGNKMDLKNLIEELGDAEFYLMGLRLALDLPRVENQDANQYSQHGSFVLAATFCVQAGIVMDAAKKHAIHNKELNVQAITDALFVIEGVLYALRMMFNVRRETVLRENMEKLLTGKNARYKDGYSDEAAHARADKQDEIALPQ